MLSAGVLCGRVAGALCVVFARVLCVVQLCAVVATALETLVECEAVVVLVAAGAGGLCAMSAVASVAGCEGEAA